MNKAVKPIKEGSAEQTEVIAASLEAPRSLVIRQGRGRLGGSTLLEYITTRARLRGRKVIVGDGDVDHASLSQVYRQGTDGAAVQPSSAQPADLQQWVTQLMGRAVDEQSSLVLDLGGGEAILRDYGQDTSLVDFCDEVGIQSVGLFMCGADPADFDHIVGIWDSGHFRPRWSIMVLNEFLAPPGRSALGAFNFILERPEFGRLAQEGMQILPMPRLVAMPDMRNAGLTFFNAVEGKPGRDGRPLSPMHRFQIRKWMERLEENLDSINGQEWLP
ncbi:Transcriptional regulatory protein (plasmid) [Roseomonas mucosa]|uniref:hypothetical protein n=1 Tax=Roseomonas mucosa TaxID=207340 RepID=UPI0024C637E8|nr:hypothetical protein [Roseomonas mucosa]QDD92849.1 Transcriptional regulatory protein [Roseomonas mucosa]